MFDPNILFYAPAKDESGPYSVLTCELDVIITQKAHGLDTRQHNSNCSRLNLMFKRITIQIAYVAKFISSTVCAIHALRS